ncbi:MAG: amidohydrolase family protein [Acidobacteria bacterium]|nr:amidohydrolase family protein [Acidobacteriota bacterium]MDA1233689.1 amidohydrolase family protein [Acidobacteriota bacterium]
MLRLFITTIFVAVMASAQTFVVEHARLIDGNGGAAVEDSALVVQDGRITYAGPFADASIPEGAQRMNMRGKTIVPGIINGHGHVGLTKDLKQDQAYYTRANVIKNLQIYASYGVTTTTDMGTALDSIFEYREQRNKGEFDGARVLTAVHGFTAIDGYPTRVPGVKGVANEVATADQARKLVDKLADDGADLIKMWVDTHHGAYPKIAPEIRTAIIQEAARRGVVSFAHVYELADAKQLAAAGVRVLGHSVRDAEADDELISLLLKGDVTYIPTVMREAAMYMYGSRAPWVNDPYFTRSLTATEIQALRTSFKAAQADPELQREGASDLAMAMKNVKILHDAGVNIGFGPDTGPPGRFAGSFEHLEAEKLVEAGLTPMEVIVAWSKTNSRALGIDEDFGTLEAGKVADFLILNANPLDNMRNARAIHRVYMGGKRFRW